ncbi:MAG: hypothetical protein ACLP7O_11940 [Terracidiphilus sp.]
MNEISRHMTDEDPNVIANRLMQKAHNRDGLPEIAIGLCFLTVAFTMWMQVVFHPGSMGYTAGFWSFALLVPAMILGSQWAIKRVRRRFLIEKVGYVQLKPVNRKRSGIVIGIAFVVAIVAAFAAFKGSFPPASFVLAGTGIGGGVLAALSGRLPRYVIGGVIMAATGILVAFSKVSLGAGFMILYGFMGVLSLISGCVVLVLFMRKPAEAGE